MPFDPPAQNLNKIERLIDQGGGFTDHRQRTKALYPFFISESGELFCVDETIYSSAFVSVLERYRKMSLYLENQPQRVIHLFPLRNNYGPGYWKTGR
jgi:hypothetical protein